MNNSIGTLLTQVKAINKKYEGINKLTGENYNIFSILQFERKEVRLHTAFLGNLLDENGSHGMGTRFLELFIFALPDRDKIKEYQSKFLPVKESKIFIEKRLGARNDLDGEEAGGQVDIRILVNGINIIIENKIGAGDQENNYLDTGTSEKPLYFFTLH
ncbi:MAG: PD-(D/E)XK nuclease family protein [Bacteroidetes bacterium]|nr:PD-(D/E)XK nuclease family protein [Bacteroidota bacterium]